MKSALYVEPRPMTAASRTRPCPLLCSLLCSLLLLAPRSGLAQQAPAVERPPGSGQTPSEPAKAPGERFQRSADAPIPGTAPQVPRRLLDVPTAEDGGDRPPDGLRILAEVGLGVVGTTVGATVGYVGGVLVAFKSESIVLALAFATLSCATGASLAVYLGGQLLGGQAEFIGPFLGAWVGGGVGLLAGISAGVGGLAVLLPALGALTGAVIGYEATEHGGPARIVRPLLSVSSRGPVVGLSGTF